MTLQIHQQYCLLDSYLIIYNKSSDQAVISKLATLLQKVWCSQKARGFVVQHPHPWTAHADDVRDSCEANLLDNLLCRYNSTLPCLRAVHCACLDQHHIAALGIRCHIFCSVPPDKERHSRSRSMRQTQLQFQFKTALHTIPPANHNGGNNAVLITVTRPCMLSSGSHATNLCIGPAFAHRGPADKYLLLLQRKLIAVSSGCLPVAEGIYLTRLLAICMRIQCIGHNFNVLMQPLSQLLRQCHDATAVIAKATTNV